MAGRTNFYNTVLPVNFIIIITILYASSILFSLGIHKSIINISLFSSMSLHTNLLLRIDQSINPKVDVLEYGF